MEEDNILLLWNHPPERTHRRTTQFSREVSSIIHSKAGQKLTKTPLQNLILWKQYLGSLLRFQWGSGHPMVLKTIQLMESYTQLMRRTPASKDSHGRTRPQWSTLLQILPHAKLLVHQMESTLRDLFMNHTTTRIIVGEDWIAFVQRILAYDEKQFETVLEDSLVKSESWTPEQWATIRTEFNTLETTPHDTDTDTDKNEERQVHIKEVTRECDAFMTRYRQTKLTSLDMVKDIEKVSQIKSDGMVFHLPWSKEDVTQPTLARPTPDMLNVPAAAAANLSDMASGVALEAMASGGATLGGWLRSAAKALIKTFSVMMVTAQLPSFFDTEVQNNYMAGGTRDFDGTPTLEFVASQSITQTTRQIISYIVVSTYVAAVLTPVTRSLLVTGMNTLHRLTTPLFGTRGGTVRQQAEEKFSRAVSLELTTRNVTVGLGWVAVGGNLVAMHYLLQHMMTGFIRNETGFKTLEMDGPLDILRQHWSENGWDRLATMVTNMFMFPVASHVVESTLKHMEKWSSKAGIEWPSNVGHYTRKYRNLIRIAIGSGLAYSMSSIHVPWAKSRAGVAQTMSNTNTIVDVRIGGEPARIGVSHLQDDIRRGLEFAPITQGTVHINQFIFADYLSGAVRPETRQNAVQSLLVRHRPTMDEINQTWYIKPTSYHGEWGTRSWESFGESIYLLVKSTLLGTLAQTIMWSLADAGATPIAPAAATTSTPSWTVRLLQTIGVLAAETAVTIETNEMVLTGARRSEVITLPSGVLSTRAMESFLISWAIAIGRLALSTASDMWTLFESKGLVQKEVERVMPQIDRIVAVYRELQDMPWEADSKRREEKEGEKKLEIGKRLCWISRHLHQTHTLHGPYIAHVVENIFYSLVESKECASKHVPSDAQSKLLFASLIQEYYWPKNGGPPIWTASSAPSIPPEDPSRRRLTQPESEQTIMARRIRESAMRQADESFVRLGIGPPGGLALSRADSSSSSSIQPRFPSSGGREQERDTYFKLSVPLSESLVQYQKKYPTLTRLTMKDRFNIWHVLSVQSFKSLNTEERSSILTIVGSLARGNLDSNGTEIRPGVWIGMIATLIHMGFSRYDVEYQKEQVSLLSKLVGVNVVVMGLAALRRCCIVPYDPIVLEQWSVTYGVHASDTLRELTTRMFQFSKAFYSPGSADTVDKEFQGWRQFVRDAEPFGVYRAFMDSHA